MPAVSARTLIRFAARRPSRLARGDRGPARVPANLRHPRDEHPGRARLPSRRPGVEERRVLRGGFPRGKARATSSCCTATSTTGSTRRARRWPPFSGRASTPAARPSSSTCRRTRPRVRLRRGREMFAAQGWNARGFIAPAWLMSPRHAGAAGGARLHLHQPAARHPSVRARRATADHPLAIALLQHARLVAALRLGHLEQETIRQIARNKFDPPQPPSARS